MPLVMVQEGRWKGGGNGGGEEDVPDVRGEDDRAETPGRLQGEVLSGSPGARRL